MSLEEAGYAVGEAESGEQALAAIADERPALVLLDVVMPGVDGWQLLRRLEERHGSIPVIMFSGQVDQGVGPGRDRGRRAARGHLPAKAVRPAREPPRARAAARSRLIAPPDVRLFAHTSELWRVPTSTSTSRRAGRPRRRCTGSRRPRGSGLRVTASPGSRASSLALPRPSYTDWYARAPASA